MENRTGSRRANKSKRLLDIEQILLESPDGIRRIDIARRLGIDKSIISRDIRELSAESAIREENGRLFIDRRTYLIGLKLDMVELEALYLAGRLFARVMRFPFPRAASAFRKIADAQESLSHLRFMSQHLRTTAMDIDELSLKLERERNHYKEAVETLGFAIGEARPVKLRYDSGSSKRLKDFRVFPIGLEPHFEGRSIYLVAWIMQEGGIKWSKVAKTMKAWVQTSPDGKGEHTAEDIPVMEINPSIPPLPMEQRSLLRDPHRAEDPYAGFDFSDVSRFRVLNIERILMLEREEPQLKLAERIPHEAFRSRLSHAWSIWTSEQLTRVRLKFSPSVAKRVKETVWHPSQTLEDSRNGGVIWQGEIAEPREMYPWIRGWGPDVEVLEPLSLREQHMGDLQQALRNYGI